MKKIFTFLFAALMSVGMYAKVTPEGTDVWDETTKTLTVNGNPVSNAYIDEIDIENLVISDAVTSIGDNAFESCIGLKSVAFGSSLASIGEKAFASCIKLESVTFPASLKSIGKSAFLQCYALTSVTITNGLESIGQRAFFNCEKLASVTIPSSVTDIGSSAFGNCKVLTGIVVAAENPNYSSADGVLFDKAKTTLIQCPGGKQGEYTVPNSVTSIGDNAFASCYLLTSVEIPNSVGEIGSQAFSSCIELTSVTIGNGVTSIGGYAFYYSSKLASVTINATTPPTLGGSALDKTAAALTIYVPAESVDDYKGAWTTYADKIEAIPGEPEPQMDKTAIYAAYPAENHPAEIEIAFINRDFTWGMEALDNKPWYASELDLMTSAEDTIKFRDKANNAKILCEFIPANGAQDGRWQQMYVKMANYEVVSFKGEMVRLIEELDLRDAAKYAWLENAPEPLPGGIENIVLTEKAQKVVVDGVVYIVRDNKLFNLQGAQVR